MAEREETLTALTEVELLVILRRHRWLEPVGPPRQTPDRRGWFVRVRAREAPPPRVQQGAGPVVSRGPRGRTITAVAVVAAVVVVAVVVVAAVLAVQWAVAHWPLLVVVGALGGTLWAKLRRAR